MIKLKITRTGHRQPVDLPDAIIEAMITGEEERGDGTALALTYLITRLALRGVLQVEEVRELLGPKFEVTIIDA